MSPTGVRGRALHRRVLGVAAAGVLSAASLQADVAAPDPAFADVMVSGERPGPGMWRVSRGGHDLWILATLNPLPQRMTWRSTAVEARLAKSSVVLAPPAVKTDIGFFRGMTLLPALMRARKDPGGRTLEQSLPHDLYVRWLALRVKFLGSSDDERLRPAVAAFDLYRRALDQSGLVANDQVWRTVAKLARARGVAIVPLTVTVPVHDAKDSIKDLARVDHAAEVACLGKVVERLETDLGPMRQRANLWSLGDIAGLRALPYPDEKAACLDALESVPRWRERLTEAKLKMHDAWLGEAQRAIDAHDSSFAVLSLTEVLRPGGLVDTLRSRGYVIEEP